MERHFIRVFAGHTGFTSRDSSFNSVKEDAASTLGGDSVTHSKLIGDRQEARIDRPQLECIYDGRG
jgi:hypothetical protein